MRTLCICVDFGKVSYNINKQSPFLQMHILIGPPTCAGELHRWAHGDYTLLHDSVKREYALDLQLHVGCAGICI